MRTWPSRKRATSASSGLRTFTTPSASHGDPSVAPASMYAASGNHAASPAPGSTTTSKPAAASFPTVSGTRATRRSPGAVSRATPTLIAGTIFDAEYAPAMEHFFTHHGLPLLFVVIMLESFGIPLPGETALIFFGLLASKGNYNITVVIVIAAAAAIVGDNLGYWLIGRLGGRALFQRNRWLKRWSDRVLPRAEQIMQRHGGKTVFFGRFIAILRFTAAWVAGLGRMPWWRFLFWNALGGIVWATAVGLVAFYGGKTAADAIQRYGLFAAAGVAVLVVLA